MATITCAITSPEKTATYDNLASVSLPAFAGQMQVLPEHAESFVLLRKGEVILQKADGKKESAQIPGGECYIKGDKVSVIL